MPLAKPQTKPASERFKVIPAIYLLLLRNKDTELLLLKRHNTGYMDGMYSLVAGHIDGNETATTALIREAKEEAGIALNPGNLSFVHAMHRFAQDSERLSLFFSADQWQGEITNKEPAKCSALDWYSLKTLPSNTIPYIRHAIESYQASRHYSEFDERT